MKYIKMLLSKQIGFGFVGGLVAALILAAIGAFKPEIENHALLSAPFLSFVALLVLLALFHEPIGLLMRRSNVTLKWGDKQIGFNEISEEIDKDLSDVLGDLKRVAFYVIQDSQIS